MRSFTISNLGILLCAFSIIWGCSGNNGRGVVDSDSIRRADSIQAMQREASDLTIDALHYADSVLAGLSKEEKVGMLYMPAIFARSDKATLAQLLNYARNLHVGGIVLLKGDLNSAAIIADTLRTIPSPGFFIAVDAENGLRMRFPDAPEFPWSRELGKLTDDQILYEFGREIARECREVGINMILGPVMDVIPGDNVSGLMKKRSLGSNPRRVADLAIAYSRGLEDGNVLSVAKHFPGHGASSADSHKRLGEIERSKKGMDSIDLYPFKRYSEEKLSGVMVGHLSARSLDSIRRPAVVSPIIMKNILREQLSFSGLVITDAINMEGAMGVKGYEAVIAGADMVIAPVNTQKEIEETLKALENLILPESVLNDRCSRILFYKYLLSVGSDHRLNLSDVGERVGKNASEIKDSITNALSQRRNNTLQR